MGPVKKLVTVAITVIVIVAVSSLAIDLEYYHGSFLTPEPVF